MQNPLKILLITNRQETVNRVRRTVAANSSSPVWWTLAFSVIIAFSSLELAHLIHPKAHMVYRWWSYLVVSIMVLVVQILVMLFTNVLASWAINRQQRKSWGVSLPDESRILGFRPGIWVGMATSYAVCTGMVILEVSAALLLTAWHKQIMSTMSTVISVMSLLYFSYAISYFYGIPKRLFVFRYVVLPVVLISIVGIIAAIMMGQYRNYENQKARHNVHSSVVAPAGIVTPSHSLASIPKTRQTALDDYAVMLRNLIQANADTPKFVRMIGHAGGTAVVSFRLTPSGHLLSSQVARSSGVVAVNRAALKVAKDIRFPPFTKDMPRHPLMFEVSIHLSSHPATTAPAARLQNAIHPARTTGQTLLATPSRFGNSSLLSSRIRKDDAHCTSGLPLAAPWLPSGTVSATVADFVSRSQALRYVMENQQNLHGMMESRYLSNQRVLVRQYGFPTSDTELALVPVGMQVFIGESVQVVSFHASHRLPCTYVPNLIVHPTVAGSLSERP